MIFSNQVSPFHLPSSLDLYKCLNYKFIFYFLRWVFSTNKKSRVFVFEFQVGINWVYHISWNLDLIFINGVKVYKIWDESFLKLQYIKILRLQIHITVWVGQYCQINLADVELVSYGVSIILTLHTLLLKLFSAIISSLHF